MEFLTAGARTGSVATSAKTPPTRSARNGVAGEPVVRLRIEYVVGADEVRLRLHPV